jgi:hypothetical protein
MTRESRIGALGHIYPVPESLALVFTLGLGFPMPGSRVPFVAVRSG